MNSSDVTETPTPEPESATPSKPTASEVNEAQATSSGSDLAAQLESAKAEAADARDRYLRAVADLENFRRRSVCEKDDLKLFAISRALEDLIPVMDNLALGLAAAKQPNADLKTLTGGVEMVLQQFRSALGAHGLKEINPQGQPFDPHQHEALSHQASNDVKPEHVAVVVRTGYTLNGRLLRPASVIISSGPAAAS